MKTRTARGFVSASGRQVMLWCPHCCGWHYHGCAGNYSAPGDVLERVSHCPADWYDRVEIGEVPAEEIYPLMYRASSAQREVIRDGRTTPAIERLRSQDLGLMERGLLETRTTT